MALPIKHSLVSEYVTVHRYSKSPITRQFTRYYGSSSEPANSNKSGTVLESHQAIGKRLGLFMNEPSSPGSPFFLPRGMRLFNNLQAVVKKEYIKYGYEEVCSPVLMKKTLWETSGHWDMYKNDMFLASSSNEETGNDSDTYGLKPMNCPGHCLVYKYSGPHSYRTLPLRLAEFSPLHRNEASGALTGITRVRKFHQDDAHIFATIEQIRGEVTDCLKMIVELYEKLGFAKDSYTFNVSTKPSEYIGSDEDWAEAEKQLQHCLDEAGFQYNISVGDGAFYGPKIDVVVQDKYGRSHQTGTIQLDFQLPKRFDLVYRTNQEASTGDSEHHLTKHCVLIHRAILGSFERMLALLIENSQGKFPLWLSPSQVKIIPVSDLSETQVLYANKLKSQLKAQGFHVDLDETPEKLSKKVKMASSEYNYVVIIGDQEVENNTVSVRVRGTKKNSTLSSQVFANLLQAEIDNVLNHRGYL